ncbi:MAG: CHAT domain-containing protein [Gammaproteobacteria bacterium]
MNEASSSRIENVKLELLRPGPAHNQLLSPLTPYIAICGSDGPVTVQMPFEHRQLLMRLRRLRYPMGKDPATDEQRQSEVRDVGEAIGGVLGQVPALLSELCNASSEKGKLIHLRLALSAFELGMIPFEAAVAPDGFPGSGSPLFLQMRLPITITREIRRGRPLPVEWNRKPRILFAFAAPDGLYVPAQAHLQALREAVEPWVNIKNNDMDRLPEVKKLLTVLPDASLEKIRQECAVNEYTHVHILAHGAPFKNVGEDRYGVALCSDLDKSADVVDGERLAIALTTRDPSGTARFRPTVVTLATCDSGNIETVITPGGSIAHELNAAGIPWVIASQFPLWMKASAIAAEVLYRGLLNGDDPRWVLYELRQRLRTDSPGTHDWASIVAYAAVPWNFERQVGAFRDRQARRKFDVKFDRIDELVGANKDTIDTGKNALDPEHLSELKLLCDAIRADLKIWREEPEVALSSKQTAERLGVSAASEKRIGIAYYLAHEETLRRQAYETSRDFYREALEAEPSNHWLITQYLSIVGILSLIEEMAAPGELAREYGWTWAAARQIAEWNYSKSTGEERVWTLATLSELALLGSVYGGEADFDSKQEKTQIKRYCKEMRELLGPDAFPVVSTKRQFRRYLTYWGRPEWKDLAKEALKALGDKAS